MNNRTLITAVATGALLLGFSMPSLASTPSFTNYTLSTAVLSITGTEGPITCHATYQVDNNPPLTLTIVNGTQTETNLVNFIRQSVSPFYCPSSAFPKNRYFSITSKYSATATGGTLSNIIDTKYSGDSFSGSATLTKMPGGMAILDYKATHNNCEVYGHQATCSLYAM